MTTEVFLKTRLAVMPSHSNSTLAIQFKFALFHHKVCAVLKQFLETCTTAGTSLVLRNGCPEQTVPLPSRVVPHRPAAWGPPISATELSTQSSSARSREAGEVGERKVLPVLLVVQTWVGVTPHLWDDGGHATCPTGSL